jgi:hypothetical protein
MNIQNIISMNSNKIKLNDTTISVLKQLHTSMIAGCSKLDITSIKYKTYTKVVNFNYDALYFNANIQEHISNNYIYHVEYNINFIDKQINIFFITSEQIDTSFLHNYVNNILIAIYILNQYSNNNINIINCYIYLTNLLKQLPVNNSNNIINSINVNTGFTTSNKYNNEVVVYRHEEWFKVLIHELIHYFDCDHDIHQYNYQNIFNINSKINLAESYTEFWARVLYLFISNFKNDFNLFIFTFVDKLSIEINFQIIQVIKILKYMQLSYHDLLSNTNLYKYKENTNVCAYYIITSILFTHFNQFIDWCFTNNPMLIKFNHTKFNSFYDFINNNKNKYLQFINSWNSFNYTCPNLRMTIT